MKKTSLLLLGVLSVLALIVLTPVQRTDTGPPYGAHAKATVVSDPAIELQSYEVSDIQFAIVREEGAEQVDPQPELFTSTEAEVPVSVNVIDLAEPERWCHSEGRIKFTLNAPQRQFKPPLLLRT